MGIKSTAKLSAKFVSIHGLPSAKRRQLRKISKSFDHKTRAGFRAALARDARDGKLEKNSTHLAKFLKAQGL